MKKVDAPFDINFEHITPARAAELLERNRGDNRNLASSRIARYSKILAQDEWAVTHQGVAIDSNGCLMDGQHRLESIVRTGIGATMMVCSNMDPAIFHKLDGGLARNAQSFLQGPYRSVRTALTRTLMQIDLNEGMARLSDIASNKDAPFLILQHLEENDGLREYGEAHAKEAVQATRKIGWGTSAAGLLIGGYISEDPQWWDDVRSIADRDGLSTGNPVKTLSAAPGAGGNNTAINYMRAVYAGTRYRDGVSIKMIRSNSIQEVRVW